MANEKRLIDAEPLVDECKECSAIEWNKSVYTTWAEAEEDFMQRLLDAPTVDAVEVVHGRWIEDRWTKWQCDKCHSPSPAYGYPRMEYVKTRYCPNCGAKMDGDGNE